MTKDEAKKELELLETKRKELQNIIDTPEITAKQWLTDFLNNSDFKVKIDTENQLITYFLNEQWIFQQDLKNDALWCYYYGVWEVFKTQYGMNYEQTQALHKEVVCEALNCKLLIPYSITYHW